MPSYGEETTTAEKIAAEIERCLASGENRFFPLGVEGEPIQLIKGSALLEHIFDIYELSYRKKTDGLLLAEIVSAETTCLPELWKELYDSFGEREDRQNQTQTTSVS